LALFEHTYLYFNFRAIFLYFGFQMKLKSFPGGVHPPDEKTMSRDLPFEEMPIPAKVSVALWQNLGKPSNAIIKKKQWVVEGQLLATSDGFISAPVHAPVSGQIEKISRASTINAVAGEIITIKVAQPPEEELQENKTTSPAFNPLDINEVSADEIRKRVLDAGIVGQGGAAFPTAVKLSPPKDAELKSLVINACECEPYLTRDYRLMLERADALFAGIRLICRTLGVDHAVVGLEDNKTLAFTHLNACLPTGQDWPHIEIVSLKTKYPQGAEKMLIKAVTGSEVPPGKLPLHVGLVIQNVGTAIAVYEAVVLGKPPLTAALTVSGRGIVNPKNLLVRIGTSVGEVIDYCGGLKENAARIVAGGPMMGIAQYSMDSPVVKATSGIVVLTKEDLHETAQTPCLRCGKCVEACPVHLIPSRLARLSEKNLIEDARDLGLEVCMECGCCSYSCPAGIPLVQWLRLGRAKLRSLPR
jgi:Na+-translocating ferredoxin:NAD+ oxidoreductase subunit C